MADMLKEKYYSKKKKKMTKAQVILNAGEYQFISWSRLVVCLFITEMEIYYYYYVPYVYQYRPT